MNGFDDLANAADEQDSDDQDEQDDADITPQRKSTEREHTDMSETTPDRDTEPTTKSLDQPAFSFSESKQDAIYPTEDTLTEFQDTLDFEVKRALRDDGIRDVPKREYHEALLQLAIEEPERLAELVKENRK